ncbi:GNAT family N-acetyltransferase [Deinococcus phoenicis]|uniref:GNAT family N-acetyltransferase n=1 Tax=Deinococcus phoenicis TaxID=1476583 RepID=UPI0004B9E1EB|nr:GNAT family N-acetyltransferase [Deinococcus phoenicis]
MQSLTFTRGDLAAASAVLTATAARLTERGEALWPLPSLTPERLLRHYPAEGWRVAWQGAAAVGTFVLLGTDPLFWPDDPPGEALYLHKLGIHPRAQGRGLAPLLLAEAARETREAGAAFLRLDTAADRPKLRALYGAAGFRAVDEREIRGFQVVRYELPLADSPA